MIKIDLGKSLSHVSTNLISDSWGLIYIHQRIITNTYWLQEIKGMKYHCKKGCENMMLIDTSVFRTKTLVYYNSKYHVRIILINNSSIHRLISLFIGLKII